MKNLPPFQAKKGKPYLETHIIWLANGGDDTFENTVYICPNCHRKMHAWNLLDYVKKRLPLTAWIEVFYCSGKLISP
ncbi:HNH endonuclease [Cytobacillus pseudoceanisediminis]|uniref:HNH endonuclease n=1 Tax=Cytobacillus pseudoceanisediminis TaxID=3051614 RepID=A0ABZ2ZGV5_9BACI